MKKDILVKLAALRDDTLLARVKGLAQQESEATANLIAHLAELDQRGLYLGEGCSSLFVYCTEVLHLSEYAAYARIGAARAARKFPVLLDMLERRTLNLTAVNLIAPVLTKENYGEVLAASRHKSRGQVEELVARIRPQAPVPSSIRKLPGSKPRPDRQSQAVASDRTAAQNGVASSNELSLARDAFQDESQAGASSAAAQDSATAQAGTAALAGAPALASAAASAGSADGARAHRPIIAPLAPELYRVQFTASAETHAKLRRAQSLLRHQIPDGNPAAIVDRALTVLLRDLEKKKAGITDRPRRVSGGNSRPSSQPDSRYIPADVRRVAWFRDGQQCNFVSDTGRRCTELGNLEFHHVHPYGDFGQGTVENIEIRCGAHNRYEAAMYFGPHVDREPDRAFQEEDSSRETSRPDHAQPGAQSQQGSLVKERPAPYSLPGRECVATSSVRTELGPERPVAALPILTAGSGGRAGSSICARAPG